MSFDLCSGRASFAWTVPADVEVTGPMKLRLHVEVRDADDAHLFVGVRKLRGRREIGFEGSYGYPFDTVTKGWLKASHRRLDPDRSEPWRPVHRHDAVEPLQPRSIAPVEIELLPSAPLFRRGEVLRLDVQGRWFFPRNPLVGQFPAAYAPSPDGTALLHCGGGFDAHLLVPLQP